MSIQRNQKCGFASQPWSVASSFRVCAMRWPRRGTAPLQPYPVQRSVPSHLNQPASHGSIKWIARAMHRDTPVWLRPPPCLNPSLRHGLKKTHRRLRPSIVPWARRGRNYMRTTSSHRPKTVWSSWMLMPPMSVWSMKNSKPRWPTPA